MMPGISTFETQSVSVVLKRFLSHFSDEKLFSDRIFWMVFYVCVGLLPPLISIIGHKAVFFPLIVISPLIIARFFMRRDCRERIGAQLTSPGVLLLLSFALLVTVHALVETITDPDRSRILGKSLTLLLTTTLLAFVWSHRDVIRGIFLLKMAFIGTLAGLLVTILKVMVMHFFFEVGDSAGPGSLITKILHIHDSINGELKVLAVFVFLVVLAIKATRKRYATLAGLLASVMVVSFFTMGFLDKSGTISQSQSETVQFGFVVALFVFALAYMAPKRMTDLLFAWLALAIISAPWLFQILYRFLENVSLPRAKKFMVRGEIWDAVSQKVLEAPFFGFGIDSVRYLKNIDMKNNYMPFDDIHHPHNMVLQLWLDLGLVGVLIFLGFIYLGWRFISRSELSERPPVLAALTMLAVFVSVTSSMWQTWIMALVTFFIVLVSVSNGQSKEKTS